MATETSDKSAPADKSVQFIAKLVQLTQDKRLRWESAPRPNQSEEAPSAAAFTASIEGKNLRLYKVKREVVADFLSGMFGPRDAPRRRIIWTAILEILDEFGQATFTFERTTGLNDLYESASYSASRVDDLMDSVLRRK